MFLFSGRVKSAVMFLFSGRVNRLAIGKGLLEFEGNPDFKPAEPDVEVGQEVEIACSGRWQSRPDRPGERFGGHSEGAATPGTVRLLPSEIYRFRADFGLTDDDFRRLSDLSKYPQFRSLTLFNCRHITKTGLCHLQTFRHLWDIDLSSTNTTDEVVSSLRSLTSLKSLKVQNCRVTQAAIKELQQALPNCRVTA
jgi:hypothetical protein